MTAALHYYVWCPERGQEEDGDAVAITAHTPQQAACDWAQREDSESGIDYSIAKGDNVTVMVRHRENRSLSEWLVTGELTANYDAREIRK